MLEVVSAAVVHAGGSGAAAGVVRAVGGAGATEDIRVGLSALGGVCSTAEVVRAVFRGLGFWAVSEGSGGEARLLSELLDWIGVD